MHPQAASAPLDLRGLASPAAHALVLKQFRALPAQASLALLNDKDPRPLLLQFQQELPGQSTWDCLQDGPELWSVRISKNADTHGNDHCCGACGGV